MTPRGEHERILLRIIPCDACQFTFEFWWDANVVEEDARFLFPYVDVTGCSARMGELLVYSEGQGRGNEHRLAEMTNSWFLPPK